MEHSSALRYKVSASSLWHVYSEPAYRQVTESEWSSCFNNVVLELGEFLNEDFHRQVIA